MLHTTTGTLQPQPPFDFASALAFLDGFPAMHGEQAIADRALTKAVSIDGQAIVFRVHAAGTVEAPELRYTLYAAEPISDAVARSAADRIAFFLSLNDDLRSFYAIGAQDEAFAPVIRQRYGHHQVKFLTPFENVCWVILSQRIPMRTAQGIKQRIGEQLGGALEVDGKRYYAFPEPAQLIAAGDALAGIVGNERKTAYLLSAAHAFDGVDEPWLRSAPSDAVEAWLLQIKGIGEWSARFVLIRGLGHMDRLSLGEQRMMDAARARYGRDLTEQQIREIGARYGAYQGYWAYYLRTAS